MKTVLITGANKGIGFASAENFLKEGYRVIITGRNEKHLLDAISRLGGENCDYILWDAANIKEAESAITAAHEKFGDIHVFVNNAGIVSDDDAINGKDFFDKTEECWDMTMDINLKGVFFALQAEARYMRDHGIEGNIVNVCSEWSVRGVDNAYGVSKWGVYGFTRGVAPILAKHGIVLNGIAPGTTSTEILRKKEGEYIPIKDSPRGHSAMPYEIAEDIFYLAKSRNIIGEVLVSDGGRSLH